jgi:hypothetical protein
MIADKKLRNALYALNGVLVKARQMAYNKAPSAAIAEILDSAELLPGLIASDKDETDEFRQYIVHIAKRHKCEFILQRFDDPAPSTW